MFIFSEIDTTDLLIRIEPGSLLCCFILNQNFILCISQNIRCNKSLLWLAIGGGPGFTPLMSSKVQVICLIGRIPRHYHGMEPGAKKLFGTTKVNE